MWSAARNARRARPRRATHSSTLPWPGVVGGEREHLAAVVLVEQVAQVPRAVGDVDLRRGEVALHERGAAGLLGDVVRGLRHQLHQPLRAGGATSGRGSATRRRSRRRSAPGRAPCRRACWRMMSSWRSGSVTSCTALSAHGAIASATASRARPRPRAGTRPGAGSPGAGACARRARPGARRGARTRPGWPCGVLMVSQ